MSDICQTYKEEYYKKLVEKGECTTEKQSEKINALYKEKSLVCYNWIPCNERLPEEPGLYIITICSEGKENEVIFDRFFYDGTWWSDITNKRERIKIIAWMPLPEPYQEKVGDE